MIALSRETVLAYERRMVVAGVPGPERASVLRWVRFYLDFCQKYGHPPREAQSVAPFLAKLGSKGQPEMARKQGGEAVHLLLRRKNAGSPAALLDTELPVVETVHHVREAPSQSEPGPAEVLAGGGSWEKEYGDLEGAIKMRNYSPRMHEVYRMWVQKFQTFTRSRSPGTLDGEDVKGFLTELAVRHNVAGSTQNQAFNALLFFYRHVLMREFGKVDGIVRAKRRPYVPVVLSRREMDAVLAEVAPP